MKKSVTNTAASVLARLKNLSERDHLDFNFLLLRYIQERFLVRLADSKHADKFVLKGGFLLLAYNIQKARTTKDIDFLSINVPKDPKQLESLVLQIASIDIDDGVQFQTESVKSEIIKEDADYEGVRLKLTANIGSARNIIQLDFGFGDIVTPHPLQMDYPTLFGRESVRILAYSRETIVAEKFEAIVRLTTFNSRMKDFYDISFLASDFEFDSSGLRLAIRNTFNKRQTDLSTAGTLFRADLATEFGFDRKWNAFRKRSHLTTTQDFNNVQDLLRSFLLPLVEAELSGTDSQFSWNRKSMTWE